MTPQEFKTIRKQIGLSQVAFGKEIGKSRRTVQRYENGILKIPNSIEYLILMKNPQALVERLKIRDLQPLNEIFENAPDDTQNYADTPPLPESP